MVKIINSKRIEMITGVPYRNKTIKNFEDVAGRRYDLDGLPVQEDDKEFGEGLPFNEALIQLYETLDIEVLPAKFQDKIDWAEHL